MSRGAIVLGLMFGLTVPALAQQRSAGSRLETVRSQRRVLSEDRQLIQRWFAREEAARSGMDRRPLPPGVVKQLVRGRPLPPGLEGEIEPLPRELEGRLNALDVSLQRGYVDGRVLVWERRSRRLVDVIELS